MVYNPLILIEYKSAGKVGKSQGVCVRREPISIMTYDTTDTVQHRYATHQRKWKRWKSCYNRHIGQTPAKQTVVFLLFFVKNSVDLDTRRPNPAQMLARGQGKPHKPTEQPTKAKDQSKYRPKGKEYKHTSTLEHNTQHPRPQGKTHRAYGTPPAEQVPSISKAHRTRTKSQQRLLNIYSCGNAGMFL